MQQNQAHDRLLTGVKAIAAEADQPERRMFHWLQAGRINGATKRGDLWTIGRNRLRRELGLDV